MAIQHGLAFEKPIIALEQAISKLDAVAEKSLDEREEIGRLRRELQQPEVHRAGHGPRVHSIAADD